MKTETINYTEGTQFAVPLRNGCFARGLVSRFDGEGVGLGYFFGPPLPSPTRLNESIDLAPDRAVRCGRFGDLDLLNGEWPLLGNLPGWTRLKWPMPLFLRTVDGSSIVSSLSESLKFMGERKLDPTEVIPNSCKDSMMGYGFVEIFLTRILSDSPPRTDGD